MRVERGFRTASGAECSGTGESPACSAGVASLLAFLYGLVVENNAAMWIFFRGGEAPRHPWAASGNHLEALRQSPVESCPSPTRRGAGSDGTGTFFRGRREASESRRGR